MKKWFAIVCFILINWSNAISAGPVTHVWNNRSISPIGELALLKNQEFAHISFDPPLEIRQDGSLFLSVALVDSESWINLALNSFVSLASHHNISGLTVMTMNDKRLASVFTRLGLYAYDASSTIEGFPEVFRLKNPLTSWSWGAVIFLRFNAWFEAFRRGIGFCFIDTDVTYNRELFFVRDRNGKFVDISTQGEASAITPNSGHQCMSMNNIMIFHKFFSF